MTKKHFKVFAQMLNAQRKKFDGLSPDGKGHFMALVLEIMWVLSLDNPRFSKDRFLEAVFTDSIDGDKWTGL